MMTSTLETNKLLPSGTSLYRNIQPKGWEWADEWHIDNTNGDEEGWQYAFNWEFKFSKTSGATSNVRKRRWVRS